MKREKSTVTSYILITVLMLASVFQTFIPSSEAKAVELSQENFVDDFSISPDALTHGEDTRISISFSDKSGNNMSAGDTLTLQVPENLEATRATLPLKNSDGVTFGVCEVSGNQVNCTFNEMVEKLNNIRGQFFYTATAGFVEAGSTVDYTTNLGTNLDGKNYSITAPEGGTEPGVFFYKTGDMLPSDPDHVRWFLNVNLKKDHLSSDINIQDTIQEGQELVEDSFSITIEDYSGQSKILTKEEFEAEQYGTVSIHNNMSFNINIYQDKASTNSFSIMYLTKITENGKTQEKFVNNYETDYTILHEEPVRDSGTHEVNNRFSGGGIEGDPPLPGTVRIIKTLNNDENLLLENVSFNIFKADGTPVNNGEPIITNNEGMVEVADLPAGEYYLQEISAPNHIEFDENNKIFFTIEPNSDEGLILSINNNIATTSVPVEKVWELQDKEAETVTIHLLADGEKVDTVDLSSENDWKHTFTDLPTVHDITDESAIVYTVEEVAVEGFDSEITGNAKDGYTVTNSEQITPTPIEPATTSVPVEKVWELQDKEAETVTIHLLADGEKVDTVDLSSENDWKHTFTDLPTVHDITDESAIVYTVEEVAVEGFDSEITGNAKDGYTVTNSEQIDLNDSGEGTPSKGKDKPSTGQTGEEIPSKGKDKPSTGHTGEVTPSKGNNEPSKGHSEAEASSENDHKDSLPDTGIANNTPVYLIITLMAIGMIFLLISYITRRKSSK